MNHNPATRLWFGRAALATVLPLLGLACAGGSKPAASPEEPAAPAALDGKTPTQAPATANAAGSAAPATSEAPSSEASSAPLGQVLETDKDLIRKMYEGAQAAPAMTVEAKGGGELAKGVHEVSQRLSAGMKPEGPLATGVIKEKHHLQLDVSMQPGKCYSIVGYSKKVKDLDLYLFMPPGILSAQDLSDDNRPVVGGPPQPMCPVGTSPLTYKLAVFADKGSGEVAVQLFSKAN